jgi:hypothetical protein
MSSVVETLPKLVEISKLAKKTWLFCVFLESRKSVPAKTVRQTTEIPAC